MIACKHCSTPNSLDSTFCKKCGTAVPADQKREAALQLDRLVDEGLAALNAERTAEALAIADSAVASDPSHLGALHLKAAVHERRGEIADALESAERIVELNPDSELDRIKRNGLRNSLLSAATPVQPDRRVALVAAMAAMVLVACAGVALARGRNEAVPSTAVASNATPMGVGTLMDNPVVVKPTQATVAPDSQSARQTTVAAPGAVTTVTTTPGGEIRRTEPNVPVDSGMRLPVPDGTGGDIVVNPILPPGPPTTQTKLPTNPPTVKNPGGVDPGPDVIKPDEPKNDGAITLDVSPRGGARTSGSGSKIIPETHTNGSQAYAQVGTERFQLGDYAGAATNLEKAVAGGGDAVQLNLRLAQAYSRLGRNSEAASAYERSRSAANAALAGGKGDKERLQAARDAADAGLKTVKGG